jgi:hypothetical protein
MTLKEQHDSINKSLIKYIYCKYLYIIFIYFCIKIYEGDDADIAKPSTTASMVESPDEDSANNYVDEESKNVFPSSFPPFSSSSSSSSSVLFPSLPKLLTKLPIAEVLKEGKHNPTLSLTKGVVNISFSLEEVLS